MAWHKIIDNITKVTWAVIALRKIEKKSDYTNLWFLLSTRIRRINWSLEICSYIYWNNKIFLETSSQDGCIGKHSSPPYTTTAKLQLKFRTTITQNHQKLRQIEVLTTTELKKPHASRLVGGAETPNRLVLYPCVVDKNSGGISQEQRVPAPQ